MSSVNDVLNTANTTSSSSPMNDSPTPAANSSNNQPITLVDVDSVDKTNTEVEVDENGLKRKLKSEVWNHFKRQKINDVMKAICNYCGRKLGGESKNGTKHLHDHFKICPLRKQRDIKQYCLRSSKTNDGRQRDIKQYCLRSSKTNDEKTVLKTYNFDSELEVSRRELASMIILHEYPLTMVEHKGFRRFVSSIQPLFKIVSRSTIRNDIFRIYENEKSKTMKLLKDNQGKIAITTDMWTASNQKKGYMAITAHFIDESWKLQSRIIRFAYVPCPHTATALSDVLYDCLLEWNLHCKLSTLTVDNCATNDAMIQNLLRSSDLRTLLLGGDLFHMRCCAHILNLIVNEGLSVIGEGIEKIRDSVAYWTATPKRVEKFEDVARQLHIPCTKKLVLDCITRWNSTYLMLKTALVYRNVFSRLKTRDSQYKCLPSENDWAFAGEMCDMLSVFYNMTQIFSGTKYPTFNMFFPEICEIKLELTKWGSSNMEEIRVMTSQMTVEFEQYWTVIHDVLTIATLLDPRYKMRLIEFYFPQIYGDQYYFEIERVRRKCSDLVQYYMLNSSMNAECSSSSVITTRETESNSVEQTDWYLKFDEFVSTVATTGSKSELDIYLEEILLPRSENFDILDWWKLNGVKYPTLYKIARDILAIPIATVASESVFSIDGRHVSPHRSRLHPTLLEALMCTQDWLWAEDTTDDRSSLSLLEDLDLLDEEV